MDHRKRCLRVCRRYGGLRRTHRFRASLAEHCGHIQYTVRIDDALANHGRQPHSARFREIISKDVIDTIIERYDHGIVRDRDF